MSHYETLGVGENATPDEIKRAYRAKAKATHPDAGGSQSDFEPVVKAYEVLSNPERRLLYDTTGHDAKPPLEQAIQNTLIQGFQQALSSSEDIEIVAYVRDGLGRTEGEIKNKIIKLKDRKTFLKVKRKKIKAKGDNLVHAVIDGELKNIEAELSILDHQKQTIKGCLKVLKTYSEDWEAPPEKGFYTFDLRYRATE